MQFKLIVVSLVLFICSSFAENAKKGETAGASAVASKDEHLVPAFNADKIDENEENDEIYGEEDLFDNGKFTTKCVEKIPNLLVSTTDSGYQDGRTCLASYKNFVHAKKEKGVKRPVLDLTDGHSSRFDIDVMEFCEKEEIRQFVSIPDATELLQLLDQCFGNLHRAYTEIKDNLLEGDHASREGFMTVLASIINT